MKKTEKSVGGRLRLKGVAISKHSKEKTTKPGAALSEKQPEVPSATAAQPEAGSGRIVTSGVTVQGFETKFREELAIGDVIVVFHPALLKVEERTVVAIISQRSLTIHERFSRDVVSTTSYKIRKDSLALQREAESQIGVVSNEAEGSANEAAASSRRKLVQDEVSRQLQKKLEKSKATLTYREKTGMWGYRVVTEEVGSKSMTEEQLLEMRVKKTGRDKFCW